MNVGVNSVCSNLGYVEDDIYITSDDCEGIFISSSYCIVNGNLQKKCFCSFCRYAFKCRLPVYTFKCRLPVYTFKCRLPVYTFKCRLPVYTFKCRLPVYTFKCRLPVYTCIVI